MTEDRRLADLRRLHGLTETATALPPGFIGVPFGAPPETDAPERSLPRSVTALELLAMPLPRRDHALAPILPLPGLAMAFAPRGIGKTFLSLSVAIAVAAGGSVLKWRAPRPRRVLYVDVEMPAAQLQKRLARLVRGADAHPPEADYLRFLASDLAPEGLPSLARPDAQRALGREMEAAGTEVLILDNLSTLVTDLRENEADDWTDFQVWLLSQRRAGRCVLLVHHAGKGGQQRGTARREDVLDTVIALRRPSDSEPERGAAFEVHVEKARGITGPEASPFAAELTETRDGGLTWSWRDLADAQRARAAELLAAGMSIRDISEETGLSRSTVHRLKQALEAGHGRA